MNCPPPWFRCGLAGLLVLAVLGGQAKAESKISFRQITRTHPVAVQRGQSRTVRVSANFSLNQSHSTFFLPAGVKMTQAKEARRKIEWKDPMESDIGEDYGFLVDVPAGQLPGVREFRIATEQSVSSVGHLLVTEFPVVVETGKDNSTQAGAQVVPVPSAVCGVIEAFEDVDHFRIHGRAGQELVCQIYAQRVTRTIHCMAIQYPKIHLMDAYLTLRDARGRVVAENDNFVGGDALLHCRLPASGDYDLEVRDSRYAGDPRYVYCVEISESPLPLAAFPLAVQQGKRVDVELITSDPTNVKDPRAGTPRLTTTWDVAADATPGWGMVQVTAAGKKKLSNPVPRLVTGYPQLVADGKNNSLERARPLVLPVGVNGRFQRPGQTHYYRFTAAKDAVTYFDVQSQRRGLAVDSVLIVMDAKGRVLATGDDGHFTKDASLYFRAPADGEYVVAVRDLNRRAGGRFVYHLAVTPSGPDFEVHGEFYYGMLAPGRHAIWFVRLKRLNGFNGPVTMTVEGLPRGVQFQPVTIPAGMDHCSLIFSADPKAPVNASLVRVRGRANLPRGDRRQIEAVRDAHVLCELRRAGASRFVRAPIRSQLLGVTKPLDIRGVEVVPRELSLRPGGKATITVRIKRSPEYSEQVLLNMALLFFNKKVGQQLPPGVTIVEETTRKLTGDQLESTFTLAAGPKVKPIKRFPIAVVARVPITYTIMTSYASNPIFLSITTGTAAAAQK
ncbi:MAG: hypothetical protein CMJ65_05760 [Planctomycetaceae bacterium]|jgi:hypothetical protein|nr:hypothetical protein [Planctomycetaceae bacterium]MDP7275451.1 hypothetical protein [Planctomycetaceae bacterium]